MVKENDSEDGLKVLMGELQEAKNLVALGLLPLAILAFISFLLLGHFVEVSKHSTDEAANEEKATQGTESLCKESLYGLGPDYPTDLEVVYKDTWELVEEKYAVRSPRLHL